MKNLFVFLVLFCAYSLRGQDAAELWTEVGVSGTYPAKLTWSAEFNTRFGDRGVNTFFPEIGLGYKIKKWFKPSIDFRYIMDRKIDGRYVGATRLNYNLEISPEIKRVSLELRLRYQQEMASVPGDDYRDDFDQALRMKLAGEYNINGSKITPKVGLEFFYDPQYSISGPEFTKMRYFAGASFNLKGPHEIVVRYIYERKFNLPSVNRHIFLVAYGFEYKDK